MATAIRYYVPYRVTVRANDLASSKAISNSWFFVNGLQLVAPPPYGGIIAGSGSTVTFLASFIAAYAGIRALLNANYSTVEYEVSALIGKRYSTPLGPITGLTFGLTQIFISTGTPHGLVTGEFVSIVGVTTPAFVNGVWGITVTGPSTFSLPIASSSSTWSGDGYWQLASGTQEFLLADTTITPSVAVGGVSGQALPLFAAASVRRLNTGTGRNFRSRVSLSPMSESDSLDGGWVAGTKTAWATALATFFNATIVNGGTDSGSQLMGHAAVSLKKALGLPTPFTQSDTWSSYLTGFTLQPNAGSITRRKPRLTGVIT